MQCYGGVYRNVEWMYVCLQGLNEFRGVWSGVAGLGGVEEVCGVAEGDVDDDVTVFLDVIDYSFLCP